MDARLLQKIEELTLYILDQNKKIKKLEKEIENKNEDSKTLISILGRLDKLEEKQSSI